MSMDEKKMPEEMMESDVVVSAESEYSVNAEEGDDSVIIACVVKAATER